MLRLNVFSFLLLFSFLCQPAHAAIIINEFLADPPVGAAGDANHDGIRNSNDDEFIEFYNSGARIEISKWTVWDATMLRHEFPEGTYFLPESFLTLFGGGAVSPLESAFIASTGSLSLNNTADEIVLKNAVGQIVTSAKYGAEANNDQSLGRFPDFTGEFKPHGSLSSEARIFSPGDKNSKAASPEVPEATTASALMAGLWMTIRWRSKRKIETVN